MAEVDEKLEPLQHVPTHSYDAPFWRKCIVLFVTSWMTLCAVFSSTSLLPVANQVAQDLHSTPSTINISTALLFLVTGTSTLVWAPVANLFGRAIAYNTCIIFLLACNIGIALAPNLPAFITLRLLSGFQGTFFHVAGQALLAEYFVPTQRGTATGFFLAGTVLGPPLGPLFAGIVVNFTSWRVIIWVQCGMTVLGLILSLLFVKHASGQVEKKIGERTALEILHVVSPWKVIVLVRHRKILLSDLTCGLLSWNQNALLAAPHALLSTQYGINSPLIAGLFYIAPAGGFLLGTIIGGHASDRTVKHWIKRRGGIRVPHDRLKGSVYAFFGIIPVSTLIYGWTIEKHVGGLALPIVMAFLAATGILIAFAGINTYCSEAMPERRIDVIATKYLFQYAFGAVAIATSVPLLEAVGAGLQSTITAIIAIAAGGLAMTVAHSKDLTGAVPAEKDSGTTPSGLTSSAVSVHDV